MARRKESFARRWLKVALLAPFLAVILPLCLTALILYLLHRVTLYLLIWLLWLPKGKDVLLVYSDSPIWHDYMATQILPLVEKRAVVLNWSERSKWPRWAFSAHVFRSFGGRREFNPLLVLFCPLRRARVFRFWSAFRDWKHGYTEPLENVRQDLISVL